MKRIELKSYNSLTIIYQFLVSTQILILKLL